MIYCQKEGRIRQNGCQNTIEDEDCRHIANLLLGPSVYPLLLFSFDSCEVTEEN